MASARDNIQGGDADLAEDLNGECFIAGAEGEPEVYVENNRVLFPSDFPHAATGMEHSNIVYNEKQMVAFLLLNTGDALVHGRNAAVAAKVAYLRFLAARNGLISPAFSVQSHHVRYNHAVTVNMTVEDIVGGATDEAKVTKRAMKDNLPADVRKKLRSTFTNLVCCVAYMFRVRGHHYMDDFLERYNTLWARCLYKPEDLMLDWVYVATDSLHAIMPDILDEFWQNSARDAKCAGTLIKRLDSAPAGAAGVVALARGMTDVTMLFPGIVAKVPEAYQEFNRIHNVVQGSRWTGSINSRFYGVARTRVDEAKIGALASVVLGVYENLASNSKLRDSMALKRLAEIAPATGGAIGLAARRAAADERLNLIEYTVPQHGHVDAVD